MATQKIIDYSMRALPFLVQSAQKRQTLFYKELAEHVGCHHRVVNHILGYLRDDICIPNHMPLINAIVVNKDTGLPGESWLPDGTDHLSSEAYKVEFEKFRNDVFLYKGWGRLLNELGLKPIQPLPEDLDAIGRAYVEHVEETGGIGEGEPHRKLKDYIAAHPEVLGLAPINPPETEYLFISGDRCDVVFNLGNTGWAIAEIKNGETGELIKGVYQAVKYRALLQAEKGHGSPCYVDATLVAYNIPSEVSSFASAFGVRCRIVRNVPE